MSAGAERERSHWGWGWADREPDRASLEALAPIVRERLGFGGERVETPVALESIDVAPSRLRPPESLAAILSHAPPDRIRHSMGRAYRDVVRGSGAGSSGPPTWSPSRPTRGTFAASSNCAPTAGSQRSRSAAGPASWAASSPGSGTATAARSRSISAGSAGSPRSTRSPARR